MKRKANKQQGKDVATVADVLTENRFSALRDLSIVPEETPITQFLTAVEKGRFIMPHSIDKNVWGLFLTALEEAVVQPPDEKRSRRDSGGSSSEVDDVYEELMQYDMNEDLMRPPASLGGQWPCALDVGEAMSVRECYDWFYNFAVEQQQQPKRGCIYVGNPGIGKSVFLNYALVRYLHDGYTVVLEMAKGKDHYVFHSDGTTKHYRGQPAKHYLNSLAAAQPRNCVYLFDPDEHSGAPIESNMFTLVASSPHKKHYKALRKLGASKRYFPCWELSELLKTSQLDCDVIEERFAKWGGIPRYVYNEDQDGLADELEGVLEGFDLARVARYRKKMEISTKDQEVISHMVLQYRVSDPFQRGKLDFASEWIGMQVVKLAAQQDYDKLKAHYVKVRDEQWQGPYAGHLWEYLCHAIIPQGGGTKGSQLKPVNGARTKNKRILKRKASDTPLEVIEGDKDALQRVERCKLGSTSSQLRATFP